MISEIVQTGETIINDDDGYRYRVFIDPEFGVQIVYEEYSDAHGFQRKDCIGLPFVQSVDAMIEALNHVRGVMRLKS